MKQVILDTSFIITCVKQKIDFFEELRNQGFQILIPEQVIKELGGLKTALALKLLEVHTFNTVDLGTKHVDKGIIDYAKKHFSVIIATLDREIKNSTQNQKLVIRGKKRLEII